MALTKPCSNCPFLIGGDFSKSGLRRAREIADHLAEDGNFSCHQTTEETGCGKAEHCFGAMVVLNNEGLPHQWTRIAGRLGFLTEGDLDRYADDCFESLDDWVEAMT